MDSSGISEELSQTLKWPTVIVLKELHTLIGTVKEIGPVTTMDEVLEGMKRYILDKQLFDPSNPIRVCCKDDQLGSVLGVEEFTIAQVKTLLMKVVIPVPNLRNSCSPEATSSLHSDHANKRKFEEILESEQRKMFLAEVSPHASPMKLYIPSTPEYCYNESDTPDSIQGYETALVKDTSDTSLSSEGAYQLEDVFDIEYEVESVCSESDLKFSDSSDSSSDINSDSEVMLNAAILTFISKTDSDQEFFADGSSEDEDEEISEYDHWECNRCHSLNKPPMRYCARCWEQRLEWLPDKHSERSFPPRRRKPRKQLEKEAEKLTEDCSFLLEDSITQCDQDSPLSSSGVGSQSSSSSQPSSDVCTSDYPSSTKLCIICCSKVANASIIHAKYAHQVTCYRCARKLQKQKKRCPICRRAIDRVVHQITS